MKASKNFHPDKSLKPATHEQITALAHELWLAQGSPEGSDVDIWLEAERQLKGYPPRMERDPIPADVDRPTPDEDPALRGKIERELDDIIAPRGPRSPTSL